MSAVVEWCLWPPPEIGGVAIITMPECGACGDLEWWLEPWSGVTLCGTCYPFIPALLQAKVQHEMIERERAQTEGVITIVFSHYIPEKEPTPGWEHSPEFGLVNCTIGGQVLVQPLEVAGPYELDVAEIRRLKRVAILIGGQRWSWDLPEASGVVDIQWSQTNPPAIGGGAHVSSI